jgi:hypothetical protein
LNNKGETGELDNTSITNGFENKARYGTGYGYGYGPYSIVPPDEEKHVLYIQSRKKIQITQKCSRILN